MCLVPPELDFKSPDLHYQCHWGHTRLEEYCVASSSHEDQCTTIHLCMFWLWPLFQKVGSPCLRSYFLKYIQVNPVHSSPIPKDPTVGHLGLVVVESMFFPLTSWPPCSLIQLGSMERIWKVSEMAKLNDVLLSKWRNHLDLVKQQVYYEGQENHLGRGNEVAQCRINVVTRCLGTQHEDYGLSVCHL